MSRRRNGAGLATSIDELPEIETPATSSSRGRDDGMCPCRRNPLGPDGRRCAACRQEYSKLWTTPPDPRYGPCREID